MIQLQLEQAAKQHTEKVEMELGCHTVTVKEVGDKVYNAFEEGASWRIESVWHDNSEMPSIGIDKYGCGKDCVVIPTFNRTIELCSVLFDDGKYYFSAEREYYGKDEVERWAYLDDLLPEEKGGKQ